MEIILQIILELIFYTYADFPDNLLPEKPHKSLKYLLCTLCFLVFMASVVAALLGILSLAGIIDPETPLLIYIIVGSAVFLVHIALATLAFIAKKKKADEEAEEKILKIKNIKPTENDEGTNCADEPDNLYDFTESTEDKCEDSHECRYDYSNFKKDQEGYTIEYSDDYKDNNR